MCVDLCALLVNILLMTFHFAHLRVSANRTDLEQLKVKLFQSILSIIIKYREDGGLRALDCGIERFCLYVGS